MASGDVTANVNIIDRVEENIIGSVKFNLSY